MIISIKIFINIARVLSWRLYIDLAQLIRNVHARSIREYLAQYLTRLIMYHALSAFPGASK